MYIITIEIASVVRMGKRMVEGNCATALSAEMIVLCFKRNDHYFDGRGKLHCHSLKRE